MSDAKVTRDCETCGKTVEMYRSETESFRYCSRECMNEGWKVDREIKVCEHCGDEFEVRVTSPHADRFCTQDCHREWQKLTNHPRYISSSELLQEVIRLKDELGDWPTRPEMIEFGEYSAKPYYNHFGSWANTIGLAERYLNGDIEVKELPEDHFGGGWQERRLEVLRRDNYQCQDCGMTDREHREKLGKSLHVHHRIDPGRWENRSDAHIGLNVVTVCTSCHGARHPETGERNYERGTDGRFIA